MTDEDKIVYDGLGTEGIIYGTLFSLVVAEFTGDVKVALVMNGAVETMSDEMALDLSRALKRAVDKAKYRREEYQARSGRGISQPRLPL